MSAIASDPHEVARYPRFVAADAMPRSAGRATSVRYASMTMSCEADRNTMNSSTPAIRLSEVLTPNAASAAMATAIVSWNTSSQPRRRPSHGTLKRSRNGAHSGLSRYGSATYMSSPILVLVNPRSVNHACRMLSDNWLGRPETPPNNRIASIRGSRRMSRMRGLAATAVASALKSGCPLSCAPPHHTEDADRAGISTNLRRTGHVAHRAALRLIQTEVR